MAYDTIRFETRDRIARITLDTPDNLNALGEVMLDEVIDALDRITADEAARALILTGAGRGFCSGAQLNSFATDTSSAQERGEHVRHMMDTKFNPMIKKLHALQLPTIAAVNGVAAGGGVGLALACDLVIASPNAKFILVFTPQLGIIPDLGSIWHFTRAFGRQRVMADTFFGTKIGADEAAAAGLIWKTEPEETLLQEADAIANRLASGPSRAFRAVRNSIDSALLQTLPEQLDSEAEVQQGLIATDDFAEGVCAFFEKREPKFSGR